jgi:hypothetical protein
VSRPIDEDTELFIMAAHQRQRHAVAEADNMLSTVGERSRIIAESRKLLQRLADKAGASRP